MEEIDQKLDQWIYNSKVRAEVRKVIEDHVLDKIVEAYKAGWTKRGYTPFPSCVCSITPITN